MDSSFGILDASAFVVFAVLLLVGVIIVVSLGRLPDDKAGVARPDPAIPSGR